MKRNIFCLLLAGCAFGGRPVTMEAFAMIDHSSKTPEVIASLGKPYAIHKLNNGTIEYEYIERIQVGARLTQERHYFITFKDGQVIKKRVSESSPPPYYLDSYEMQTTQDQDVNS